MPARPSGRGPVKSGKPSGQPAGRRAWLQWPHRAGAGDMLCRVAAPAAQSIFVMWRTASRREARDRQATHRFPSHSQMRKRRRLVERTPAVPLPFGDEGACDENDSNLVRFGCDGCGCAKLARGAVELHSISRLAAGNVLGQHDVCRWLRRSLLFSGLPGDIAGSVCRSLCRATQLRADAVRRRSGDGRPATGKIRCLGRMQSDGERHASQVDSAPSPTTSAPTAGATPRLRRWRRRIFLLPRQLSSWRIAHRSEPELRLAR